MDLTLGSGWPFGGPQIPITQAAGRLRVEKVRVPPAAVTLSAPPLREGENYIAAFAAGTYKELRMDGSAVQLGDQHPNEVWFFVASPTRQKVKRPSVGAEGFRSRSLRPFGNRQLSERGWART